MRLHRQNHHLERLLIDPNLHRRCNSYPTQLNEDGTINLAKSSILTISGFVRSTGEGDAALQKVLREKKLI
jgi:hypothetical protein